MAQVIHEALDLPRDALRASTTFTRDHLDTARALIGTAADESLVIHLPPAEHDQRDWRRALARDLARAHAPARVNVVAAVKGDQLARMLAFLEGAKGVTGHYLEVDD